MAPLDSKQAIAVVGAGAMGMGIAQVAAKAGHPVLLYDVGVGAAQKGLDRIAGGLAKLVERGRMDEAERSALLGRISIADNSRREAPRWGRIATPYRGSGLCDGGGFGGRLSDSSRGLNPFWAGTAGPF